ncbi:MAG: hypothetical protein ACXWQO_07980 [Bdellovibrionota bacterium]
MKTLLLGITLLALSSCSHAYVRQWGNNQVTACCPHGNIVCNGDKLNELAQNQCGGQATAIGGGLVDSGAMVTNGWGGLQVRNSSDSCMTYSCGRAPASR